MNSSEFTETTNFGLRGQLGSSQRVKIKGRQWRRSQNNDIRDAHYSGKLPEVGIWCRIRVNDVVMLWLWIRHERVPRLARDRVMSRRDFRAMTCDIQLSPTAAVSHSVI